MFIHLRAHTDYSLGKSAIRIKELVKKCVEQQIPAICLAEYSNLFSCLEFSLEAQSSGIQPIHGAIIPFFHSVKSELFVIAKNEQGFSNLLKLVSNFYLNKIVDLNELKNLSSGLIVLIGRKSDIIGSLNTNNMIEIRDSLIQELLNIFSDNLYIEIGRESRSYDSNYEDEMLKIALNLNIPIVATNELLFLNKESFEAQDALSCIISSKKITDESRDMASEDSYFRSSKEMMELFQDLPEAIENTVNIAKRCSFFAKKRNPALPKYADNINEEAELSTQAHQGLEKRLSQLEYQVDRDFYFKRLEFELSVINKMEFPGYFLIVSDFIKWSKSQDIPVGPGRGSGAGSIVAWSLEITDLDPIRFGLLFERFLNPDRVSMPDFDIDFCQYRRDEVISYVRKKYSNEKVANIITFGKLQPRAVLRDVGRVLGIDYPTVDKICKMIPVNPTNPITLSEAIQLDKELRLQSELNPTIDKLLKIGLQLEGVNRHVSTHAAGIVIGDRPLIDVVPLYKDESVDSQIVQYSMKYAEYAGLVKFDFLGLKTLTMVSWASQLISKKEGKLFDIAKLNYSDPQTYKFLSSGKTIGVFQFESAGMKESIKKLQPDKIEDLIALGSLYRPGPMDNIPSYINRKHGIEQPEYIHPKLEDLLKETYGIIVYQEQVIMIAQVIAGYSLGEADLLRRAMGKKNKEEMKAHRAKFIKGAIANGVDAKLSEEIFNLIDKFASYGFNKSHAAAYAIISYYTAYIKTHYPLEFYTSSLNLDIHDTDKINLFISDAKQLKIDVLPPCINNSSHEFIIEENKIRYSLAALKNVGKKNVELIVEARGSTPFASIDDFAKRVPHEAMNKRVFENLVKSGALDSLEPNRNKLLNNYERISGLASESSNSQRSLFDAFEEEIQLKDFPIWDAKEREKAEFEAIGFYLIKHPIEEYIMRLERQYVTWACDVDAIAGEKSKKLTVAGVIISKRIKSSKRGKFSFLQISDHTGILDISLFDSMLLTKYSQTDMLDVGKLVLIKVDARKDDTGLRVIIDEMKDIESFVSQTKIVFNVMVENKDGLDLIKSCQIANSYVMLRVSIKTKNGDVVSFQNPVFINYTNIALLKESKNLKIVEI